MTLRERLGSLLAASRIRALETERDALRLQRNALRARTIQLRRIDAEAHRINPRLAIDEELDWQTQNAGVPPAGTTYY